MDLVHCVRFHHIYLFLGQCLGQWLDSDTDTDTDTGAGTASVDAICVLCCRLGLWFWAKQCGNSANTQVLATAPLITRWPAWYMSYGNKSTAWPQLSNFTRNENLSPQCPKPPSPNLQSSNRSAGLTHRTAH